MIHPIDHTRFIVGSITIISTTAIIGGMWLLWKGFAGGGECIMIGNTAVGGLIGFLSSRGRATPPQDTSTTSTATGDKVVVTTATTNEPAKKEKAK